jgi:endogenous inhibitor of DNA gyrase (YacG/DUF329 family)
MKPTQTEKTCPICGKKFTGSERAQICSKRCHDRHRKARLREAQAMRSANNEIRFANLIKYVEDNNLKPILQKYKSIFRKAA